MRFVFEDGRRTSMWRRRKRKQGRRKGRAENAVKIDEDNEEQ